VTPHVCTFPGIFASAAIRKCYRLVGLNSRHVFFHNHGGQKSKIKVPAASIVLFLACRWMPFCYDLIWGHNKERERGREREKNGVRERGEGKGNVKGKREEKGEDLMASF
jgi:hypothetical protein